MDVDWTGGTHRGVRVADLDLLFQNTRQPISAKSVSTGNGTERNLGARELMKLVGYDPSHTQNNMLTETITALNSKYPKIDFGGSFADIQKVIDGNTDEMAMKAIAKKVGHKYQKIFSSEILDSVNKAKQNQVQDFINYIGLQNSALDKNLLIFVCRNKSAFFKSAPKGLIASQFEIDYLKSSKKFAHEGFLNGVSTWTFQVNATNGLGMSTIAYRAFIR
jgi:hypothetical protein